MRSRLRPAITAIAALFVCLIGITFPSVQAQQDERAVRAAYLFNLTKYVAWPSERQQIVICTAGSGTMGEAFKSILQDKVSDGRRVVVLVHPPDAEFKKCDIAYIPATAQTALAGVLSHTAGYPVLTVGETGNFARQGGMVGLIRSGDQIQIEVNLDAVHARGLTISSRLLNLAVLVRTSEAKR